MKNIKKIVLVITLLILFTIISAVSYSSTVAKNISESVFRLHVIANSDSEEDQNLKYKVRDNLIHYMNSITQNITTKDSAIQIAKTHEKDFYNIAKETIIENGYDYDVSIEIGNSFFPTKNYGDISLPAGYYDALKVEIGSASGQNWWCVMFPPLCFVDISSGIVPSESKDIMKNNLPREEYTLISDSNDINMKFKFKLVEFLNKNQSR